MAIVIDKIFATFRESLLPLSHAYKTYKYLFSASFKSGILTIFNDHFAKQCSTIDTGTLMSHHTLPIAPPLTDLVVSS